MSYYITNSGVRIDPTNIKPEDINLHDIAHHLTKICRYGGALDLGVHYSVAQHSIQLAKYFYDKGWPRTAACALLHDATEAYLGDIVTGLKGVLSDYKELEKQLSVIIAERYKLIYVFAEVAVADKRIVLDEALAFIPHQSKDFAEQLPRYEPLGIKLHPETKLEETYYLFLWWCNKLGIKD